MTRALSAFAAAFVVLAGTTAVFRATGVLDFDVDNAPAASVHIEPSAPRAEYYDEITAAVDEIQPATANGAVDPAQARHALVEADGAVADGGAGAQTAAPESEDSAAGVNALIAGDESSAETTQESEEAAGKERLLARSATREMRTENFDATHTSILNLVEEYGRNVVNDARQRPKRRAQRVMAVDVPADELDALPGGARFRGRGDLSLGQQRGHFRKLLRRAGPFGDAAPGKGSPESVDCRSV